ncbi:unnamed protein product [Urochloa humidicola]
MASSRTAWIAAGLVAHLLMLAVLAMAVQSTYSNKVHYDFKGAGYDNVLQSYKYAVVAAAVGMAGSVLQIPVAFYLLCKRMKPNALILDASTYADIVVTVVLASGVGAGFGATGDVLEYIKHAGGSKWIEDDTNDLIRYYHKGNIAIVFLLIGMVLSLCATVASVRLRVKASSNELDDV